MTYVIAENYSPLNNYSYDNKSRFASAIDWLSTPCRRVFGGRTIYLHSQVYETEMSLVKKVMTVAISIFIIPIGIISVASFALKLATFPWKWEKKIVQDVSKKAWEVIDNFDAAIKNNQYDAVIGIYRDNPHLFMRTNAHTNLFKAINSKINDGATWNEIQRDLPLLHRNSIIELVNYSVKKRLYEDLNRHSELVTSKQIIDFIENSCKEADVNCALACYEKLLSSSLQVDVNENIILNAFRMDLADDVMKHITYKRISMAKTEAERESVLLQESLKSNSIFKKDQDVNSYYMIFNMYKEELHKCFADLRNSHQQFSSIDAIIKIQPSPNEIDLKSNWKGIKAELTKAQGHLNKMVAIQHEAEKKFALEVQSLLNTQMTVVESLNEGGVKKAPEVDMLKAFSTLDKLGNTLAEALEKAKIELVATPIHSLMYLIRLKRAEMLLKASGFIKSSIDKYLVAAFLNVQAEKNIA